MFRATLVVLCFLGSVVGAHAQVLVNKDLPVASSGTMQLPLGIHGWAIDTRSTSGTGIDQIQIWAEPQPSGTAIYVGGQTTMLARTDVAAAYGSQFLNSGYGIIMSGIGVGTYRVVIYAHSVIDGQWTGTPFFVTVPPSPWLHTEGPLPNAQVTQPFMISGIAMDASSTSGTGVDAMAVYASPNPGSGVPAEFWGTPTMNWTPRNDIAAVYGPQFVGSGWKLDISGKAPGVYTIMVYMHTGGGNSGTWTLQMFNIWVDLPNVTLTVDRRGTGTGGISGPGVSCPGGAATKEVPCIASYPTFSNPPITAVPDAGSTFIGWGGACAGAVGATCAVPLYVHQYVVARFEQTTPTQTMTYYHTDAIGSVRALTSDTGATVTRHDYGPFGEDTAPLAGDPKRFAGKDLDVETALQNFEARMYRNVWGRFLTVDPVAGTSTDPQAWNRYAYAHNNPLRYRDPLGLDDDDSGDIEIPIPDCSTICQEFNDWADGLVADAIAEYLQKQIQGGGGGASST